MAHAFEVGDHVAATRRSAASMAGSQGAHARLRLEGLHGPCNADDS